MSPAVAPALRALGFDAVDQRDVLPAAATDNEVLAAAWMERRVIVARDYDMAELVLRGFAQATGVVIVAFDFADAVAEATRIAAELTALGHRAHGAVHIFGPVGVRSRQFDPT